MGVTLELAVSLEVTDEDGLTDAVVVEVSETVLVTDGDCEDVGDADAVALSVAVGEGVSSDNRRTPSVAS